MLQGGYHQNLVLGNSIIILCALIANYSNLMITLALSVDLSCFSTHYTVLLPMHPFFFLTFPSLLLLFNILNAKRDRTQKMVISRKKEGLYDLWEHLSSLGIPHALQEV